MKKVPICEHSTNQKEHTFYSLAICTKILIFFWHNYILNFKKKLRDGKKVHKNSLFLESFVTLTRNIASARIFRVTIRNKN